MNSLGPVRKNRRSSIAPCERRVLEAKELLEEVRHSDPNPEAYFLTLGELAVQDYWIYLRLILDYRFLDPWDHGEEMVWFLQKHLGQPMLFLVPRGGAKTGTITVPILPWLIARDPTLTGIIANIREEKASYFAKLAAGILMSENYARCFPYVRPSKKWGEGGYYLKQLKNSSGGVGGRVDPNIGSFGVGGNITGAHVRAMAHDDLVNEETSQYPSQLAKAESFFKESLNCLDPGGTLVVAATRWTFGDLYGKMVKGTLLGNGAPFQVFTRGAERVVLDDNNQPTVEVYNAHRTYVDFRGLQQQVGYTEEFLEGQKVNLGSLYYALYMNTPVHAADSELSADSVKTFATFAAPLAPAIRVGVEIVSAAATFWDALHKAAREQGKGFSLERIQPAAGKQGEKQTRIRSVIGPLAENGRLYCREDLWNREGNIGEEIRQFPKGEDDALDALAYCILKAAKFEPGKFPRPYIAVDPAFTNNKQSDHTAVLCGCWYGDDFWILDCHKFKAQKVDLIINQIFRMQEKYRLGSEEKKSERRPSSTFVSPGNERRLYRGRANIAWGRGNYHENVGEHFNDEEGSSQQNQRPVYGSRRFR